MSTFIVSDMTCGHCVSVITKAILQLQDDAKVEADLAKHTISVSSDLSVDDIAGAIKDAGYMATEVTSACCNSSHSCKN